ncbi:Slam-dependent surface lipoprotein [Actinobacillus arthritidis]|uniref:Slam-dependent surface lipoprotein n=1 Tax=Actinobacillus arthritidis TaxID=157339 RepID=UPI0024428C38|nr:Slam-dependent surface lipoprotein [Actinobacillus arthritidis]WGE89547.1 transferrin-binding protein-like solute binding protein [Actinobacillus arthritidis]
MKKLTKLGLAVLSGIVLSACSSGGDGGNSDTSANTPIADKASQSNQSSKTNNSSATKPSQVNNASSSSSVTGNAIVLSAQDDEVIEKRVAISGANTEIINVDGKSIRVSYKSQGISAGTWLNMNGLHTCCDKYSAVRFGVIENPEDESSYVFYNGLPTESMPTSGTATYHGDALITGSTTQFENEDWLKGTSKFNVDFGAKKLNGSIDVETLETVNITADISGNSFDGKAHSDSFSTQAKVEGKFYGDNAKELGGMLKDDSKIGAETSWGGVFGASQ